jgi:hypothetical protein
MTGTEVLMEVAESFRDNGEAKDLIIVYSDTNDEVYVKGNCSLTRALGLATYSQAHIAKALLESARTIKP